MVYHSKVKRTSSGKRTLRDPEVTKAEILDAAEEEFAKYGLAGTRVDAIAGRTGVTKAMIYYYFQSKEELYQAVMQRLVNDLHKTFAALNLDKLPADQAIKKVIYAAISYEASNPNRGMLWYYEAIQNDGKYGEGTGWQQSFWDIVKLLNRGITEGVFRPLDPFFVTLNIIAACTFYFDAYKNLKYLAPDQQLLSSEMIEKYTEETINFILNGILNSQKKVTIN